ncbi:MAG: DUF2807 domain-containing protein [Cyclobacteriaceae bacterium]
MNRIIIITLFLSATFFSNAQETETRTLRSFESVSVSQGIEAFLAEGTSESARVEVDGNIDIEEVLTEVNGGHLKIHLEGNNYRNVDVRVYVTYVNLESLKASSAGSIEVEDRVTCDCDFDIDVSSAGDVEIDLESNSLDLEASSAGDIDVRVRTGSIDASASSAGDIDIEGIAKSVDAKASSSGDISAYDLVCDNAELRASSGGSITITVKEELKARSSSGGSISYKGNPEYTDKESSSGGSVRGR